MRLKIVKPQHNAASTKAIFRFEVQLLSGPVAPSFVARNPEAPSRIIDIRGSQTLDALHEAIFNAFDREDAHMYEFQIGGKKPMDRKAVRYGITLDEDYPKAKNAAATTIVSLNLNIGNSFLYWFDFGDDWWHEVSLLAVNPPAKDRGRYPRIVERKGESPPQYVDWESEESEFDTDIAEDYAAQCGENTGVGKQRLDGILALIKDFCKSHLTEGYVEVCERLLESSCGAWLPLKRGNAQSWAAGLVHAAGMINFLHDPAASGPHMKLRDIAQHFGVSPATMGNKSREIRDAINAFPLDPRFCLPERLADNPLVWLKKIDGIVRDLRMQPREMQEAALEAGLIPFIPKASGASYPQEQKKTAKKASKNDTEKDGKKPEQYSLFE